MILLNISDTILLIYTVLKMLVQYDTMSELIVRMGQCDLYLWSSYVKLNCPIERQAPIRHAPLSSENSCYFVLSDCY